MGIPGLTTYIVQRSDIYLQPFELHNTYLVIDGNSICSQLYVHIAKCNCAFGGDYDKFAQCVNDFFDGLLKCNIIPLVLIDGGTEDKKLKTVLQRSREKVQTGASYNPTKQRRTKFFPLLIKEVFKFVMIQKCVKFAMCTFEADDDIAAIARILNCPVLSYDSDFYIYDVMYIPFDTLESNIFRISGNRGYMKRCKMYKVDYLLRSFVGLNKSVLPLVATLLGNDYVKKNIFKNFFRGLKLPKTTKRKYNDQQKCIEATLNWLRQHTLDSAIVGILSRLPHNKRKKILKIIEMVVNSYASLSPGMLTPLGFSPEHVVQLTQNTSKVPFKFQRNVDDLKYELAEKENDSDQSEEEEEEEEEKEDEAKSSFGADSSIYKATPKWFIEEFNMARFPSYFLDMLTRQVYLMPPQIEDYSQQATSLISLKIVQLIYKLLSTGVLKPGTSLQYYVRNNNSDLTRQTLECTETILNCEFPSLYRLRKLPLIIRKKILDDTLEVDSSSSLELFPPHWKLYIATTLFWLQQEDESPRTNCHMYALLCSMLFGILDSKIGYHRSQQYFQNKYGHVIDNILSERKRNLNFQYYLPLDVSVTQALEEITVEDCIMASHFFILNFEIDQSLFLNPKKFNVTIVHSFAQFQSCLRHSMHLNALLGYPYQHPKISELFNGTLLYNLYLNFKERINIDDYIKFILRESPSLLRLFQLLVDKVRAVYEINKIKIFENKGNRSRHRKHKSRGKKRAVENSEELDEAAQQVTHEEIHFTDDNNRFSMLSSVPF